MKRKRIILPIVSLIVLGLIVGAVSWFLLLKYYPKYTARTFIKVLPPVEKDPAVISSAMVNRDIQYGHRVSVANLIKRQSTLQELLDRDKIRETEWFKRLGKSRTVRIGEAYKDLMKRFGVSAQRDADFVSLSMTCSDKQEAADIVNEMVDMFLASQGSAKQKEVADKLATLKAQRVTVQRELRLAEETLDGIRKNSGFTDLEERTYPDPITARLIRLELEQDNCILEIAQQQANIKNLEKHAEKAESQSRENLNNVRDYLIVLESKLDKLKELQNEASRQKRLLDLARVQYEQQVKIRDERRDMLDELKSHIEKRVIMHDDPETSKVQFAGYAPVPLDISSPKWNVFIPAGAIAGLILGIALALPGRKAKLQQEKKI
jgi:capsular polysaccharide biosynthesis protein